MSSSRSNLWRYKNILVEKRLIVVGQLLRTEEYMLINCHPQPCHSIQISEIVRVSCHLPTFHETFFVHRVVPMREVPSGDFLGERLDNLQPIRVAL